MNAQTLFVIAGAVAFGLSAANVTSARINWFSAGWCLLTIAWLVGSGMFHVAR